MTIASQSLRRAIRTAGLAITAFAVLSAPAVAQAQLFSTGLGNGTSFRQSDSGPSQRVLATKTTQITSFGFWIGTFSLPVDFKFMIWDDAGANLLFQQVRNVASVPTGTLVLTNPMSFTMVAGQTYDFAILGDGNYDVSYFFPTINLTQNGLTLVNNNRNYGPYASPVYQGEAGATIALQINGTQPAPNVPPPTVPTTVPEPSSVVLLAAGIAGLGLMVRRRRA